MDTAIVAAVADLYHFFRLSALGATLTLPLQGAASVDRRLAPQRAAGLMAVAAAFHAFAYVHNDVCDLALDRTQPRRAHYPLVRGTISPRSARAVALACVPLAFALDALLVGTAPGSSRRQPSSRSRRTMLAAAFGLLAAYNLWGKRCPLPPLTDALQGAGWAALLHYGAAAAGCPPTALTRLLAAYELLLIVMVNGIHGALRDLANDQAHGARTTAILLGAMEDATGRLQVTPALAAYAAALQATLLALPAWGASGSMVGPQARARVAGALGVALVEAAIGGVLVAAGQRGASAEAGMAHLLLLLSLPLALVLPNLPPTTATLLLAAHLLPPLSNGLTHTTFRWAIGLVVHNHSAPAAQAG